MTEQIDMIQDVEEAIAELQAMKGDHQPDPRIEAEIRRLDSRLRRIEQSTTVFARPA